MSNEGYYDELNQNDNTGEQDEQEQQSTTPEGKPEGEAEVENKEEPTKEATSKRGNRRASADKTREAKDKAASKVSSSASKGTSKRKIREYEITLHDSGHFPPGGLTLGKNGQFKRLYPEKTVWLDQYWKEVLDHAVEGQPKRDDKTGQVIGRRNVTRFPYTIGEIRDVEV